MKFIPPSKEELERRGVVGDKPDAPQPSTPEPKKAAKPAAKKPADKE